MQAETNNRRVDHVPTMVNQRNTVLVSVNDYLPLDIDDELPEELLTNFTPQLYKLNISACHVNYNLCASTKKILIYGNELNGGGASRKFETTENTTNAPIETTPVRKVIFPDEINHVRSCSAPGLQQESVAIVGDSGVVALILVDDQTGNARCFHFTMPQVESAWSVCYNEHFLVCGSNSHRLTVWPIQKTDFSSSLAPAASTDESFTSVNVAYGHMTETNKLAFELPGHDHNVPCIDMHPTKNLVASVSIDGSVKIWRLSPDQSHCACLNQWRVPHPSDPSSSTYTRRTRNTGRNRATSNQDSPTRQETRQNAQLQQADEETANGQQDLGDDDDDDNLDEREWAWSVRWYPNSLSNSKFIANDEQFKNHSLFVHRDSHERLKLMANMQLEEGSLMESTTTEESPNLGDNNSNVDERPDSDDLLVIGTKHHVYLLNASTFELLSWFFFCPKRLSMYLPHSLLSSFSRLSLLEVIPEFSCILVASQTDKKILLVRVLRHMCPREQKMKYCMKPEAVLPNGESKTGGDSNYPIGSFSTQILPNRDGFLVRILFLDKSCRIVVVKSGFTNLMDPCFQVSEVMI